MSARMNSVSTWPRRAAHDAPSGCGTASFLKSRRPGINASLVFTAEKKPVVNWASAGAFLQPVRRRARSWRAWFSSARRLPRIGRAARRAP